MSLERFDEINSTVESQSKAFPRCSTPISDPELETDHQEQRFQRKSSARRKATEYGQFIHYLHFPNKAEPFKIRGIRTSAIPDNSMVSGFLRKDIIRVSEVPRNVITHSPKTYNNVGWVLVPSSSGHHYGYQNAAPRLVYQQYVSPSVQHFMDTRHCLQHTCHLAQKNYCTQHSHTCTCAFQQFYCKFKQYLAMHYIQPNLYAVLPQQRYFTPQDTYCPYARILVPLQTMNHQDPSTWIRYPGVHYVTTIEQSCAMPLESA